MNAFFFFYKRREEKKEGECSVCSRQKIHCAVKLYIHIRNLKPRASASRILVTVNKITLPTILSFCPQKKRKAFNSTFFSRILFFISDFLGSSNISDKRAAVSRLFCGPLSNTFPSWSRAGGTTCRQRFALNILLACSNHLLTLSGVSAGMLCPFLYLLLYFTCFRLEGIIHALPLLYKYYSSVFLTRLTHTFLLHATGNTVLYYLYRSREYLKKQCNWKLR